MAIVIGDLASQYPEAVTENITEAHIRFLRKSTRQRRQVLLFIFRHYYRYCCTDIRNAGYPHFTITDLYTFTHPQKAEGISPKFYKPLG